MGQCDLIETDFMTIPEPDESFDAIYAFEAICHAPDKTALFKELLRLLRPGGLIGIYEWCLTEKYDNANPEHLAIKRGIEEGNGLPDISSIPETRLCFEKAGFKVLDAFDRAEEGDEGLPWYHSLAGREMSLLGLQRSRLGRVTVGSLVKGLELLRIAPKGAFRVQSFLSEGADALVAAGEAEIFTPMAFFLAQKKRVSAKKGS
jgi:sterol 24-C-methyltransferase